MSTLVGCSPAPEIDVPESEGTTFDIAPFAGKPLGVAVGNPADEVIKNDIGATPVYYPDLSQGIEAVRRAEIDGFVADLSIVQVVAEQSEDLQVIPIPTEFTSAPVGSSSEPAYPDQLGILTLKPDYSAAAFEGRSIGVITNTLCYYTTEALGATPVNYAESAAAVEDIRQGEVDGYMNALSVVRAMAAELGDPFIAVAVPTNIFSAQLGGISHDQATIDSFNTFLAGIEKDGTLDAMKTRWLSAELDLDAPMPDITNTGENGVLIVATTSDAMPYAYQRNGEWMGFSVELALLFGAYEGKTVEFVDIAFGALIPFIADQNADISLANMVITPERAELVLFTDPFCNEQHGILAMRK